MSDIFTNPWMIGIGVTVIGDLILYYVFGIGEKDRVGVGRGGRGGNASSAGQNSTAIGGKGGKGGRGGVGGNGGDGGSASSVGDGSFAMGGEGGEAGQKNRGGKGGRGPLHVLMEDYPEKFKEISETFGITEEMAKKIGKGGDGGEPNKSSLSNTLI